MSSTFVKSSSAPSTPTEQSKEIIPGSIKRKKKKRSRVHFPSDDILVTCYLEPPNPWPKGLCVPLDSVITSYTTTCTKHGVIPLNCVLDQLNEFRNHAEKISPEDRLFDLSLVGEKISMRQCEALEGVFTKIKFDFIDLEGCTLENEAAAILFDMIEYYDSAVRLNISYMKRIDCRGWQAFSKMMKKTNALVHLNARSTELNEQVCLIMGKALRIGSNLVTLHLENCGIFGRCLVILVAALKSNTTLRELFLAENKVSSSDGFQFGNLLRTNTHLQLLDLSNNKLGNEGLIHLMESLGLQSNTSGRGLSTLILWNNDLTGDGMDCVSKALNSARTLTRFNLGSNAIGDHGIKALKHSFTCNQTLEILELENCNITTAGVFELAEYLSSSTIIQKVDLRGNDIGFEGVKRLSEVMQDNHSIVSLQLDSTSTDSGDQMKERLSEIQLINESCSRNKEESRFKPVLDVHLSTLFNGIFSRVLPVAYVDSSGKVSNFESNVSRTGRFQVFPVFLDNDNSKAVDSLSSTKGSLTVSESAIIVKNSDSMLNSNAIISNSMVDSTKVNLQQNEFNNGNASFVKQKIVSDSSETRGDVFQNQVDTSSSNEVDDVFVVNDKNADIYSRRHSDASVICKQRSRSSEVMKPNLQRSGLKNGSATHRELVLHLPENTPLAEPKERRFSSPIVRDSETQIFRKVHSIKCCKALESLDLCSSIPISPTRLYENFSFPQPSIEDVSLLSSGAT